MTANQNVLIGAVALAAIVGGLMFLSLRPAPQSASISNKEDAAVRDFVQEFGARFKNVSLLADDASVQVALHYGDYVSPNLIAAWQADATAAPGRQTSSPWPERIEVNIVNPLGEDAYQVTGTVIEVANADAPGEPVATYPITLTVERNGESWVVTAFEKGAYSPLPRRMSVVGRWECLPHKDTRGPQTLECAFGIALEESDGHLAVDTMLMSSQPVDFPTGTRVRIEGVLTPMELLSADQWQKYDIDGILSAISIQKID